MLTDQIVLYGCAKTTLTNSLIPRLALHMYIHQSPLIPLNAVPAKALQHEHAILAGKEWVYGPQRVLRAIHPPVHSPLWLRAEQGSTIRVYFVLWNGNWNVVTHTLGRDKCTHNWPVCTLHQCEYGNALSFPISIYCLHHCSATMRTSMKNKQVWQKTTYYAHAHHSEPYWCTSKVNQEPRLITGCHSH